MAEQEQPMINLPGPILRKPLMPGPNSWAQSQQEQHRSSSGEQLGAERATNRDKYEHKPMPQLPADSLPHNKYLQAKAYIQAAIPLVNPIKDIQSQQKRAVTDPVPPKPLFASRKLSVAKLRKKYSFSKAKDDTPEAESMPTTQQLSPVVRFSSEKVAEVLGLYLPPEDNANTPPASAALAAVPDLFSPSSGSVERTTSPAQQVQSTPAPTHSYSKENNFSTPKITKGPLTSIRQMNDEDAQIQRKGPKKAEDGIFTPGMLHPSRLGRYGNVGEVGLVEANGMHRVESFSGVIENAESYLGRNGQIYASSTGALSQSSMTQGPNTGDLLPPVIYSPSNYGGVWENDPAVGYSLPPFSPMPNALPPRNEASRIGSSDKRGMPVMSTEFMNDHGNGNYTDTPPGANSRANPNSNPNPNTAYSPDHQPPFPPANSWVSGNSFTSTNTPLSALLPPSWPNHHSSNSVPSPPHNQLDYQRPGSMSAAIARLELTLHHHIDRTAGSLSRLISDKHDGTMDQIIRRLENIEEIVSKGFRSFKADFKDIRKDIDGLKGELEGVIEGSSRAQDFFKGLNGKLEALEKGVKEHSCQCLQATAERSPSVAEIDRQQEAVLHGWTESARGDLGQNEQRQQHRSGTSRSSNSAHHSGNSNRAHRSTTSKSQPGNKMVDEMDSRREYFAELGAARGPMPDLRDHPAFSGMQQAQGQMNGHDQDVILNGLPYEHPSLSDGRWYQQAYGQNPL